MRYHKKVESCSDSVVIAFSPVPVRKKKKKKKKNTRTLLVIAGAFTLTSVEIGSEKGSCGSKEVIRSTSRLMTKPAKSH